MRKEKQFRKKFLFEPEASDTEQTFLERGKSQYIINFTYEIILRHGVVLF